VTIPILRVGEEEHSTHAIEAQVCAKGQEQDDVIETMDGGEGGKNHTRPIARRCCPFQETPCRRNGKVLLREGKGHRHGRG